MFLCLTIEKKKGNRREIVLFAYEDELLNHKTCY